MSTRERTIRWQDPLETGRAYLVRSGLDSMRGMVSGEIAPPPVAMLMGMHCVAADTGYVRFTMRASEEFTNPQGTVHGGIIATLLDTVMTCAAFTELPLGKTCTTTDLSIQFVRPIPPDGAEITAEGFTVSVGTTRGTARAEIKNATGKLLAFSTGGIAILEMPRTGG